MTHIVLVLQQKEPEYTKVRRKGRRDPHVESTGEEIKERNLNFSLSTLLRHFSFLLFTSISSYLSYCLFIYMLVCWLYSFFCIVLAMYCFLMFYFYGMLSLDYFLFNYVYLLHVFVIFMYICFSWLCFFFFNTCSIYFAVCFYSLLLLLFLPHSFLLL